MFEGDVKLTDIFKEPRQEGIVYETGWYHPEVLHPSPRLPDPVDAPPIPEAETMIQHIEVGLARLALAANGGSTGPETVRIDIVDLPRSRD